MARNDLAAFSRTLPVMVAWGQELGRVLLVKLKQLRRAGIAEVSSLSSYRLQDATTLIAGVLF